MEIMQEVINLREKLFRQNQKSPPKHWKHMLTWIKVFKKTAYRKNDLRQEEKHSQCWKSDKQFRQNWFFEKLQKKNIEKHYSAV